MGEIGGGIIVREDGTMIGVVGMRDERGEDAGNDLPQPEAVCISGIGVVVSSCDKMYVL